MLNKLFIAVLIFALFATAYFDQSAIKKKATETELESTAPAIDYYINDFKLASFDEQGRLDYSITGESLIHIDGPPSRLKLKQPKTQIHAGKWENWSLLANQAKFSEATHQWEFSGHVNIAKLDNSLWPFAIDTTQLTYNPKKHTLNTKEYVVIKHPYGKTKSLGMTIDLHNDQIELTSKVNSRYQK